MAVLDPLKVVVTNWDQAPLELTVPWHPRRPEFGSRTMSFGRELYIDRSDFALVAATSTDVRHRPTESRDVAGRATAGGRAVTKPALSVAAPALHGAAREQGAGKVVGRARQGRRTDSRDRDRG